MNNVNPNCAPPSYQAATGAGSSRAAESSGAVLRIKIADTAASYILKSVATNGLSICDYKPILDRVSETLGLAKLGNNGSKGLAEAYGYTGMDRREIGKAVYAAVLSNSFSFLSESSHRDKADDVVNALVADGFMTETNANKIIARVSGSPVEKSVSEALLNAHRNGHMVDGYIIYFMRNFDYIPSY